MSHPPESKLIYRIIVALVIILGSIGVHRIFWAIWQGETLSVLERLMSGGFIIISVLGLIYVIAQRIQMRSKETFRREKW